jgi:hypothetical protein
MSIIATNIFIIRISLFIGFFFVISSLFLFTIIILKRYQFNKKEKREEAFTKKWRPILLENLYRLPENIESISPKDSNAFLLLWNNLQSILKGPEKEQLNQLARSLKMDQAAYKLLFSRKRSQQLLGIIVMGNLKQESSWQKLSEFSKMENITLAMSALQSMAKINPGTTIHSALSFMKTRNDWPDYKMIMILNEIGASIFSKPLADMLQMLPPNKQKRFLSFMRFADGRITLHLARDLLNSAFDFEVIAGALNLIAMFGDARDLNLVKGYLHHEKPFIRMRTVRALAEIGNQEVLPDLEKCLTDSDWWVRFRTAQAIAKLPKMNTETLLAIRNRQTDRFAVDILNYIIS